MVPNHLFQLLSLTAMEPPISFDARKDFCYGKKSSCCGAAISAANHRGSKSVLVGGAE